MRLRIVVATLEAPVIERGLAHLGLPAHALRRGKVRGETLLDAA